MNSLSLYPIQSIYEKLRGDKEGVHWDTVVWNRLIILKHRFIIWLAVREKLQTIAKLARIGVSSNDQFLICQFGVESHEHMFFSCPYNIEYLAKV